MIKNKKVLVTGGAGYIGSHTILQLVESGNQVISVDNYSNSTNANFKGIHQLTGVEVTNYEVDLCDTTALERVFKDNSDISYVIHFAASKYVGESCKDPMKYYRNNLFSMVNLLDMMQKYNVPNIIFSSSCTVYGSPDKLPVDESTPIKPAESPYGRTKQICEDIIIDLVQHTKSINAIILRYFNPAGIHKSGLIRETTSRMQETLIPIVSEVLKGKRKELVVFGSDYETRDGTALRDYIHVVDLAAAHVAALKHFERIKEKQLDIFNIGLGAGVTVKEIIEAVEEVTGKQFDYRMGERRAGDIAATYANISKATTLLDWTPVHSVKDLIRSIL